MTIVETRAVTGDVPPRENVRPVRHPRPVRVSCGNAAEASRGRDRLDRRGVPGADVQPCGRGIPGRAHRPVRLVTGHRGEIPADPGRPGGTARRPGPGGDRGRVSGLPWPYPSYLPEPWGAPGYKFPASGGRRVT